MNEVLTIFSITVVIINISLWAVLMYKCNKLGS